MSISFYFGCVLLLVVIIIIINPILACFSILKLTEDDIYISYLPLAHIFDRVIEEMFIYRGASIGFWRGVSLPVQDSMPWIIRIQL